LSRIVGDIPAHALGDMGRRVLAGLKQFLAAKTTSPLATAAVPDVSKAAS
jgi:hypothetical protein